VDDLIASQTEVIARINRLIIMGQDWKVTPFSVKAFANAAGGRSEEYMQASKCIKHATDKLEKDILRAFSDFVKWGMCGYAEMEKGRSETFIEYLREVKRICSTCSRYLWA